VMAEDVPDKATSRSRKPGKKNNVKNLSYGVLSSTVAIHSVSDHHRPIFGRTKQPQLDGTAFVANDVREVVRPRDYGDILGSTAGQIAKSKKASMHDRSSQTYNFYHKEFEFTDCEANRLARTNNRRILPLSRESVPLTLWSSGTQYGQDFGSPSNRRSQQHLEISSLPRPSTVPAGPVRAADPVRVSGYSLPMQSTKEDALTKTWIRPDLCARREPFSGDMSGSGVAMTGSIVQGDDLRSTTQDHFRPPSVMGRTRSASNSRPFTSGGGDPPQNARRSRNAVQLGLMGVGGIDHSIQHLVMTW
jgi:hypothetical protein